MDNQTTFWIVFNCLVALLLYLDLGVINRKSHVIKMKEALLWSAFWVLLALIFNVGIYLFYESPLGLSKNDAAWQFLTGYVIERSLSIDNIFVFVILFAYFDVPAKYQHKVLFWGIIGALVSRAIFIFAGVILINKFVFLIYVLGAFLIFTGIKLVFQSDRKMEPEKNPVLILFKKFFKVTTEYHGGDFFVRLKKGLYATPLFIVLLVIETTDIIFAVDSIPAILAVTRDPFIVYSSNIFAILGLRALYFAMANLVELFHYLNYGLALILIFVGVKMIVNHYFAAPVIPTEFSLLVILVVLSASIILSLTFPKKKKTDIQDII